ncbi:MAG: thioredoxin domain-containing protein [Alicyclobacillus sp.]|nr:thioredoxin domain-containing protein [Alicyclobacillus sp.]
MERESFEDDEVAGLLNQHYIPVKVDREERPDIDHIYMTVCQAMTGQGGWPLTVILTPDRKPMFAGTYFPKTGRYGRPGLLDILRRVRALWERDRDRLKTGAAEIMSALAPRMEETTPGEPGPALVHEAYDRLAGRFDEAFGGFGPAPKFPTPHNLVFLLRYARAVARAPWAADGTGVRSRADRAVEMAERTLEAMYRGGLFDHVGFGFARYSTDRLWLVPHFEKMLYDNALLAIAYTEAHLATGRRWYGSVAEDVLTYVLRSMTSAEGGFYSAEDADSEGEEGKFYLWTPDEVRAVLGEADGLTYCQLYDITPEGNFEGRNIPNLLGGLPEEFARARGLDPGVFAAQVRHWNQLLWARREQRVHPHKDDKVLTAWNGLMMAAMAVAGRALGRPEFVRAAERAEAFVRDRLTGPGGRLLARYRDGEAKHLGYADDYAFLIWGLLELYQATFDPKHLERALALQRQMVDLFWDQRRDGFFLYGSDGEPLVARPKEVYDGATPSANSVAAMNLLRLARMTGDPRWEEMANRQLRAFAGDVAEHPDAHAHYLAALLFALGPGRELVLAGRPEADDTRRMADGLNRMYLPEAVCLLHPDGDGAETVERLAPFTAGQRSADGQAVLYICENFACRQPESDWERIRAILA